ncbi:hypothetical protein BD560DRAFT_404779 [Blakeslea trispora]|nr:hypothetical protein BD560DRAFT_404779 [Blakeslea trispora]
MRRPCSYASHKPVYSLQYSLLRSTSFPYLSIPTKPGNFLDPNSFTQQNINKSLFTTKVMSATGIHKSVLIELTPSRF